MKVGSLVGKSSKEMRQYEDVIKQMSVNSGQAVGDLTEAMYQAISAGISFEDSFSFVEGASKLAVAGFTDTKGAVGLNCYWVA